LNPKGFLFLALVNLYKAMGGGWVLNADELTALAAGAAQK
jgi:outer membrane protein TolC